MAISTKYRLHHNGNEYSISQKALNNYLNYYRLPFDELCLTHMQDELNSSIPERGGILKSKDLVFLLDEDKKIVKSIRFSKY